jgi:hypothetical protein
MRVPIPFGRFASAISVGTQIKVTAIRWRKSARPAGVGNMVSRPSTSLRLSSINGSWHYRPACFSLRSCRTCLNALQRMSM